MMNTTATSFRKNLFSLLDQAIKFNEPINISTKNGNAVILSADDYNELVETLKVSSNSVMREKIIDGLHTDVSDCVPETEVIWQMYQIVYTKKSLKDIPKLKEAGLATKAQIKRGLTVLEQCTAIKGCRSHVSQTAALLEYQEDQLTLVAGSRWKKAPNLSEKFLILMLRSFFLPEKLEKHLYLKRAYGKLIIVYITQRDCANCTKISKKQNVYCIKCLNM